MPGNSLLDRLRGLVGSDTEFADPDYECRQCGSRFDDHHAVCPECGGRSVEQADWEYEVE